MNICVFGLWHLGSVTSACLASIGHDVIGLDKNVKVVDKLNLGKAPLFEPELDNLIQYGISNGNLSFTTSVKNAVSNADVLWISFDTPVDDDDKADVTTVINQIMSVLPSLKDGTIVIVSSQLPVGTIRYLEEMVKQNYTNKTLSFVCSPENLRLGGSLNAFLEPDRVIVGFREDDLQLPQINAVFSSITSNIEWMSVESAEMTKHAINAFLASSIAFANELGCICELVGAEAIEVTRGLKTESRIGPKAYLSPGAPFAGGTLARDIEFLKDMSDDLGLNTPLLSSIKISNNEHKNWVKNRIQKSYDGKLEGISIAIWGLTYKAGTNTLRRSYVVDLCDWLLNNGARLNIYDPKVNELPDWWAEKTNRYESAIDAIGSVDALVVGAQWKEFCDISPEIWSKIGRDKVIIDPGRYLKLDIVCPELNYIFVGKSQTMDINA